MDVHPPHEPIRTAREFFLHLFTITIGLLIAVGIEGIVEWRHHEHLVSEATETLRAEVLHNSKLMNEEVRQLTRERRDIDADLEVLKKIQDEPTNVSVQDPALTANFRIVGLQETAWKTAQSTGAVAYMSYSKAQRYADIYKQQEEFAVAQHELVEDQANLMGLIAKYNLAGGTKVHLEQADALAEVFGRWRGHLVYLDVLAKVNAANFDTFLQNKPAPTEMQEDLK